MGIIIQECQVKDGNKESRTEKREIIGYALCMFALLYMCRTTNIREEKKHPYGVKTFYQTKAISSTDRFIHACIYCCYRVSVVILSTVCIIHEKKGKNKGNFV